MPTRSARRLSAVRFSRKAAVIDATGCTVVPGFVDPHTHLCFLEPRETEFLRRLDGLRLHLPEHLRERRAPEAIAPGAQVDERELGFSRVGAILSLLVAGIFLEASAGEPALEARAGELPPADPRALGVPPPSRGLPKRPATGPRTGRRRLPFWRAKSPLLATGS